MKSSGQSTLIWWLGWITLTIGTFFLAVWFWTPFIADRLGPIREGANTLIWIVAVFGTWLVFLAPLMVVMYWKVDKAYEDARVRREMRTEKMQNQDPVKTKTVYIDSKKRRISKALSKKLKDIPDTIKGGHLVTTFLKDGRKLDHVFVANRKWLMGVYDQNELTFETDDIIDLEVADLSEPPDFTEKVWLKLENSPA